MDNMDGGITAVCTKDGKPELIFSNDRYYSQLGYTREQFNREVPVYFDAIHPDDRQKAWNKVRETMTSKAPGSMEYRCIKRDGSIIYVRSNIAICHIDGIDGDVMITVETDITELVKAQKSNAQTSGQLRAIMDNMSGGVAASVVRDGKVHYLFANNRYYELLGYEKTEYESKFTGSFTAIHPDDREKTNAVIRQAATDLKPYSVEFRVVRKDGSIRWLFCNISIVDLPDIDEPVHLAAVNDTTTLHEARQKELETADRIRAIMDNATCGITAVIMHEDKTVDYLLVNDKYYELVGYTREQYAEEGLQVLELMHADDAKKLQKQIIEMNTVGQTGTFKFRARRRDGRWIWLRDDITVISLDGIEAPVQLSCFTNITSQQEAIERLNFVNGLARELLSEPDYHKTIQDTLKHLRMYFSADRCYIIELDYEKGLYNNTYEVCAEGVSGEMARLHDVPFSEADYWYTALTQRNFFKIEDVSALDNGKRELRELLQAQNIHSLIFAPLWRDGRLIGFAGVDNPSQMIDNIEHLTAPADYITVLLTRRDLEAKIDDETKAMFAVMNGIPGGFVRLHKAQDGQIKALHCSDGYRRLVGMTKDQIDAWIRNKDVFAWIHPDDVSLVKREIEKLLAGNESTNVLYRLHHEAKGYIWVNAFAKMRKSASGEVFINLYYADATEKKNAEQLQLELLDNIPCGAALYEYDGKELRVKHLNRHYWSMVGRANVEYKDISFIDAVFPDDRQLIAKELASAIHQNRNFSADIRIKCAGDTYKPFHIVGEIALQENGKYLCYAAYTPVSDEVVSVQSILTT